MLHSIRKRLTLWYVAVLAVSLIVFAFVIYYAAAAVFYERQDESLRSTATTVASAYMEELDEEHSFEKANQVVLAELLFPNRFVEVVDIEGHLMARSRNLPETALPISRTTLANARGRKFSFATVGNFRVAVVPLSETRDVGFAAVAEPLSVIDEGLRRLRRDFYAGVPLVLLLASVGGYFLARKSLSPITRMNAQTQLITADRLAERLDVTDPDDEVGQLATTINDLLGRLQSAFAEQQRFIADASHELRTPLAVLRGETEIALTRTRSPEEYSQSLSLISEEAERLSRIVDDLFILARQPVDANAVLNKRTVSLNDVVRDCARAGRVLANGKGVRMNSEIVTEAISVSGDDQLLKRMVLNLVDNATKYTPAGGEVFIGLQRQNGTARIVVRDSGIGIPEADQKRVFDRFYRVDKARSRDLGGAGLGLSIVRWIVEVHDGRIELESVPRKGSEFVVELPLKTTAN